MILLFKFLDYYYRKRYTITFVLLLGVFYIVSVYQESMIKKGAEYTCVKHFIDYSIAPGVPVFLYRNQIQLPFRFLDIPQEKMIALPYEIDYEKSYDFEDWAIQNREFYEKFFSRHKQVDTLVIVTDNVKSIYGVDYYPEYLHDYIEDNFTVIEEKQCTGTDELHVKKVVWKE